MINKIKQAFSAMRYNSSVKLDLESADYSAYIFCKEDEYGVYIPYKGDKTINERFNLVYLKTMIITVSNVTTQVLTLSCKHETYKNEFATICYDFINLGENNKNRNLILDNPFEWFDRWKSLIGNRKTNLTVYDVLGEMQTLIYLYSIGNTPSWNAMNQGTHDIETDKESYEVKSTIKKTNKEITISSQYQLSKDNKKELYLSYCMFEQSDLGICIDDLSIKLIDYGFDKNELEIYLEECGFALGKKEREKKYIIREMNLYHVDENFPKLNLEHFKTGKLPEGVLYYSYIIELSNVKSEKII